MTLVYLMWSPKSPVILPGKQRSTDTSNTQYFFDILYNQEDGDDGYYEDADMDMMDTTITTSFIDLKTKQQTSMI
jgi:hypothetical protein